MQVDEPGHRRGDEGLKAEYIRPCTTRPTRWRTRARRADRAASLRARAEEEPRGADGRRVLPRLDRGREEGARRAPGHRGGGQGAAAPAGDPAGARGTSARRTSSGATQRAAEGAQQAARAAEGAMDHLANAREVQRRQHESMLETHKATAEGFESMFSEAVAMNRASRSSVAHSRRRTATSWPPSRWRRRRRRRSLPDAPKRRRGTTRSNRARRTPGTPPRRAISGLRLDPVHGVGAACVARRGFWRRREVGGDRAAAVEMAVNEALDGCSGDRCLAARPAQRVVGRRANWSRASKPSSRRAIRSRPRGRWWPQG